MYSIRKWFYKPKKTDSSLLAQFYYADEELNMVATELDSFDGRKDPERCATLVNQLRVCQDKVLTYIQKIMDEAIEVERANRDFRVKFPDDVLQESLAGQLWFGAECLAAGSSIVNREVESASMRPLARALTKNLDSLRAILRDQCLKNINSYTERIKEALVIFDKLFAEFELSYVSAMVPVKTMREYDLLQEVIVLFSETVQRSLGLELLSQDMIDDYDPALMFTIPRLAIVCGLLIYPEGPLNPDNDPLNMPEMFRPFQTLLFKIRELLYTLSEKELSTLEKALCSQEEPKGAKKTKETSTLDLPGTNTENLQSRGDNCSLDIADRSEQAVRVGSLGLESPIIVHTPNSGSPVTPVHEDEHFSLGQMSQSPSIVTIVAQTHSLISPETERLEELMEQDSSSPGCMNHQDSSDSGMHSENTSMSEQLNESTHDDHIVTSDADSLLTTAASISQPNFSELDIGASLNQSTDCDIRAIVTNEQLDSERGQSSPSKQMEETYLPCPCSSDPNVTEGAASIDTDSETMSNNPQQILQCEIPEISVCGAEKSDSDNTSSGSVSDSGTLVQHPDEISMCPEGEGNPSRSTQREGSPKPELQMDHSYFSNKPTSDSKTHYSDQLQSNHSKTFHKTGSTSSSSSRTFDKLKGGKSGAGLRERDDSMSGEYLEVPRIQALRYAPDGITSSCSSCRSGSTVSSECDWDRESCASSETSSYNSECHDDEEIALAIQAAELASRNEARSRFRSSSDLIHRLFVCISGVADQLQTNYASDLRNILKSVFDLNCSEPLILADDLPSAGAQARSFLPPNPTADNSDNDQGHSSDQSSRSFQEPPLWVPDEEVVYCSSCKVPFTLVRRRHHCRNCGKIYCSRCSSNSVPLPHFGHVKPVRVCNHCFMFQVTPFTMAE